MKLRRLFLPRLRGFRVIDWKKDRRSPELQQAYENMYGNKRRTEQDEAQERRFRDSAQRREFVQFHLPRATSFLLRERAS